MAAPLETISAAAAKAQPGDTITVHEGVYRERINPPRGGTSDDARIVYQAAQGDKVVIKGSEQVTGWEHVEGNTWKATVPNTRFGDYNPYGTLLKGAWYAANRPYHTGAVDVLIKHNHVYNCEHWGGIWLDWMAQGARLTGNLLHDNSQDLMFEVNHGPHLVDNNILLSGRMTEASGGGAYVHNLWGDVIGIWPELSQRLTQYFRPHSTDIIDTSAVDQDDDRYFNNLFTGGSGTSAYDHHDFKVAAAGNVFLSGAKPSKRDKDAVVAAEAFDPGIELEEKDDGWWLEMKVDPAWQAGIKRPLVTSELLGKATVPDAPFENRDGTPCRIDTDYFGEKRSGDNPSPGPFRPTDEKRMRVKVWPKE